MNHRVVVTGLGAVTPLGTGVEEFWQGLIEGKSGVGPITRFDASELPTRIAAEVRTFDPLDFLDRKEARRMDRFTQYAAAAAIMAKENSGLSIDGDEAERVGVLIGSGIGGIETLEEQCRTLYERGPNRVSPFMVPMMIPDMASGQVSILLGAKGHNSCTMTACATGANAIGDAFRIIERGDAVAMITGGAEAAISKLAMAGFCAAKTLSTRNDEPTRASRPFDLERDGFVMGEGAGILVLEELNHALDRGATILAEIVGYGATGDAYHITSPSPEGDGASRAMSAALSDAGLKPTDIGYINAHGTSTTLNDVFETLAIKRVFGDYAYKVPISSTKSMTGHLLGAAGGIESIASIQVIRNGVVPPTINYENPDERCDLDYVPNAARQTDVRVVMSNSFGFGGHNAVLVFARYEG